MRVITAPDLNIRGNQLIFNIFKGDGLPLNDDELAPTTFISVRT
jgi:hypothetical protein